jgi:hypothetical protein
MARQGEGYIEERLRRFDGKHLNYSRYLELAQEIYQGFAKIHPRNVTSFLSQIDELKLRSSLIIAICCFKYTEEDSIEERIEVLKILIQTRQKKIFYEMNHPALGSLKEIILKTGSIELVDFFCKMERLDFLTLDSLECALDYLDQVLLEYHKLDLNTLRVIEYITTAIPYNKDVEIYIKRLCIKRLCALKNFIEEVCKNNHEIVNMSKIGAIYAQDYLLSDSLLEQMARNNILTVITSAPSFTRKPITIYDHWQNKLIIKLSIERYKSRFQDLNIEYFEEANILENALTTLFDATNKLDIINRGICFEIMEEILEQQPETKVGMIRGATISYLEYAFELQDKRLIKFLLQYPEVVVNPSRGNLHSSLLQKAVDWENVEIVESLLNHPGIDQNTKAQNIETLLIKAVKLKKREIIKSLLSNNSINPNLKDDNGWSPIESAIDSNDPEIVQILLQDPRIDIKNPTHNGLTLLEFAIAKNNVDIDIIKTLFMAHFQNNEPSFTSNIFGNKKFIQVLVKNIDNTPLTAQEKYEYLQKADSQYCPPYRILDPTWYQLSLKFQREKLKIKIAPEPENTFSFNDLKAPFLPSAKKGIVRDI